MNAKNERETAPKNVTAIERRADRELVITRTFNVPARIIFDAWTKPELLKRWWVPCSSGVALLSCEADIRVGGGYRYVFGRNEAQAVAFSGIYTEIERPSRLVYSQIFEPMRAAGEAVVTATFDEREGKTHLRLHSLYPSKEALDGAIASGMERGVRETMDQLEELAASFW